jgi:hypothetical protein
MTDDEVLETRNDLEMMRRPHLWPSPGRLPVKREAGSRGRLYDCGLLLEGGGPTVHPGPDGTVTEPLGYETLEKLLADGWVVD